MDAIGSGLLTSTVAVLFLAYINATQLLKFVIDAIGPEIRRALRPAIEEFDSGSDADYHWDCWIEPERSGKFPGYIMQTVRIERRVPRFMRRILLVCGHSDVDGYFKKRFGNDDSCVLRWGMDNGQMSPLSPVDDNVFSLHSVMINYRELKIPGKTRKNTPGGELVEYSIKVPDDVAGEAGTVSFTFSILKWVGNNERIDINSALFRSCLRAEFRISAAPELNVSHIEMAHEVNRLTAVGSEQAYRHYSGKSSILTSCFRVHDRISAGSSVRFLVHRNISHNVRKIVQSTSELHRIKNDRKEWRLWGGLKERFGFWRNMRSGD